jgi:hypothetical protein
VTHASSQVAAGRGDNRGLPPSVGRYGILLLVLIATYLLSAFTNGRLITGLQVALFLVLLLIALRTAPLTRRTARLIGAVALAGSVAAAVGVLAGGDTAAAGAADIWNGLLLFVTAAVIVRRVLSQPAVTLQSIYGALSAYMIIGLMFAAFYGAIGRLDNSPFFANGQPANIKTYQYFSFATLTTLGYGDFTAAGNNGRAIAVLEALTGQVFLATLVARLVAGFRQPGDEGGALDGDLTRRARRPAARKRQRPAANRNRARSGRRTSRRIP